GCVMAQTCHTGACPSGVATQDKHRQKALVPENKAERVFNFHANTLKALGELLAAAGLDHPSQVKPFHINRRMADQRVALLSEIYTFCSPGELLLGLRPGPLFERYWDVAQADRFSPDHSSWLGVLKTGATSQAL
ncbi:MAG TPA: glutamate synthase-related protein, partial [Limnobacter sp.]|nr:glutamate synthase-related protein [Limnobacter sp.]